MNIKKMIKDGKEFELSGGSGITTTVRDDFIVTQIGDHMANYHMFKRPIKSVEILNLYEKAKELGEKVVGIMEQFFNMNSLEFNENAVLVQLETDEVTKVLTKTLAKNACSDWKFKVEFEGTSILVRDFPNSRIGAYPFFVLENIDFFYILAMTGIVDSNVENASPVWILSNAAIDYSFIEVSVNFQCKEKLELNL